MKGRRVRGKKGRKDGRKEGRKHLLDTATCAGGALKWTAPVPNIFFPPLSVFQLITAAFDISHTLNLPPAEQTKRGTQTGIAVNPGRWQSPAAAAAAAAEAAATTATAPPPPPTTTAAAAT